jgi:hypothetical protein
MNEYNHFYKFLEARPFNELADCVHRITDMMAKRNALTEASSSNGTRNASGNQSQQSAEEERVKRVLGDIALTGFQLPHGMNGYNKRSRKFVRFLPGHSVPVSISIAEEHGLKPGWYLDGNLSVWLNWNTDGYLEMSRKDSARFNSTYSPNKHLFAVKESAPPTTPSQPDKRKEVSPEESGREKKKMRVDYQDVYFTDSNGSEGEEQAFKERPRQRTLSTGSVGSPTLSQNAPPSLVRRKTEQEVTNEVKVELERLRSTHSIEVASARSPRKIGRAHV